MSGQRNPVVFVHGYSDKGASWQRWREVLCEKLGIDDGSMHTCTYVSLDNGVSIKDIAEAFDRALAAQSGLDGTSPFDAVVHSTGMLVVRAWLAADPLRAKRLKRLIALAPATFGSPLAKQGRSWLGAVFKGNKQLGPDFLEAGDQILLELELASEFGWRLAEQDVFADPPRYDAGPDTPWVFVFCGTGTYSGLREIVDKPGTDGTVRRAGCGMRVRAIALDMTKTGIVARRQSPATRRGRRGHRATAGHRRQVAERRRSRSISSGIARLIRQGRDDVNHATILSDPFPTSWSSSSSMRLTKTDPARRPPAATRRPATPQWLTRPTPKRAIGGSGSNISSSSSMPSTSAATRLPTTICSSSGRMGRRPASRSSTPMSMSTAATPAIAAFMSMSRHCCAQTADRAGLMIHIVASSGTTYVAYLGYGYEEQTEPGSSDASLNFEAPRTRRDRLLPALHDDHDPPLHRTAGRAARPAPAGRPC